MGPCFAGRYCETRGLAYLSRGVTKMQKVSGNGLVFAEFDGHVIEYDLRAGQQIIIDTGNLAAMTATCGMDIQSVGGVKNALFGGEGFFNTVVTGPGKVWLQTMPASRLASVLNLNAGR